MTLKFAKDGKVLGPVKERIEFYLTPPDAQGCRLWTGATNARGYGWMSYKGTGRLVHRVIWTEFVGPIPGGLDVLHSCDRPPCGELSHLRCGTPKDNATDRMVRNRGRCGHLKGETNPRCKISEDRIIALIKDQRRPYSFLAKEHGIPLHTVKKVKQGRNWAHLPRPK